MSFLSSLMNALPGAAAQGLAWGIMAIGVYITFRILDVADLTVDGSLATGGAVCVMLIRGGFNPWIALLCAMLAGMLAGLVTGLFHTRCGIPAILAGILTQLALYSINLRIMDSKANQALSVDKYPLLLSQRYVRELSMNNPLPLLLLFTAAVIAILYWFFGTEKGSSLRATGANPHMARAQGINTNSNIVLGLMVSNGLVALSGALLAQYQGSSDINMGRGAIVIGLAAIFIGIVLGLVLGSIPIAIPGVSTPVKLGLAGGPIVVGILIGCFGPRFHLITYTTRSANLMLRGIGLSLYLACLGLDAGAHFFETVMRPEGAIWIGLGFAITFLPVVIMALIALRMSHLDFGSTCGMLCGSMANPMALNYANDTLPGDNPAVSYATVYPLSMFSRVIIAQLILMFFL